MPHSQAPSPEPAQASLKKPSSTSTAHFSSEQLAQWNTSTRLIASLLSDQLIDRTPVPSPFDGKTIGFLLHGKHESSKSPSSPALWIGLSTAGERLVEPEFLNWPAFHGDFAPPVAITTFEHVETDTTLEFRPSVLLNHLRSALDVDPVEDALFKEVSDQLTNSAENGRHWIEWYASREPLSFQSSVIDWEQSLYTGHPLHPMHRAFSTEDPLPQIAPENITSLNKHSVSLISVPGSDVRISGPFRTAIAPLLEQHGLNNRKPGTMILPCLTMQIPVIKKYHPKMEVAVKDAFNFQTQSSLRTMTIPFFDYDLKVAVDAVMSSSLRCISSRTVCIISEVSTILEDLLPENLWVMGDVGGVAGSQTGDNIDDAKHIGCTIRENHSRRALANNETLVVTGALQETPPGSDECVAAILYNLKTEQEKMAWFSEYTEGLIETFVGPVLDYGIALEPHAQNVLVRINRSTGKIVGWAVRDLGSIRIHLPTIAKSGRELFSVLEHSVVPTTNEFDPWRFLRFCLFDNHLNIFIYRLGVPRLQAWAMIREKLDLFFESRKHLDSTNRLRDFLYSEEIQLKAFMRMKFARMARVYGYVTVPNILLEGLNTGTGKTLDKADEDGTGKETNGHQNGHLGNGSTNGSEVAFFSRA